MRTMQRAWVTLASLTLAISGCNRPAPTALTARSIDVPRASAADVAISTWTRSSFLVDGILPFPCAGEDFHVYGEVSFIEHDVANASGGSHFNFQIRPVTPSTPFSFTGLTTGRVYLSQNGLAINEESSAGPGDQLTFQDHDREVYVNVADNRDRLLISLIIHTTVNANGDLIVNRVEGADFQCVYH
jgi:hypothetical protein